jgi:hypothetical protein
VRKDQKDSNGPDLFRVSGSAGGADGGDFVEGGEADEVECGGAASGVKKICGFVKK